MYQGTGISLRPALNVACDGLNGGEERETLFSGSRDALDSNSNPPCLCQELLKAWLYTVPFLFFKYNDSFTHSPRITFQRRSEKPVRTWFLLSLSGCCQPLECWSQKYFIPASFIKLSGQVEHVWYRDLIESWRLLKMPCVSHTWSEQWRGFGSGKNQTKCIRCPTQRMFVCIESN